VLPASSCVAAAFGALVYALMPAVDVSALAQTTQSLDTAPVIHAFHVAFAIAALVAAAAALAASRVPQVRLWA